MTDVVATNQTILVVGGGISGMTAALEAAECGKDVILIEKKPSLGGRVAQLYKYFPKMCHPTCGMEINLRRIKANQKIRILTMAEVTEITGDSGNYSVNLTISPRYVTENCTSCAACGDAVETEFDDEHNYGLKKRKGAYLPFLMAYPQQYVIDPRLIGTADADKAKSVCKYDAINLEMQEETLTLNVGAIIWATGWKPFDANKIQAYGYDRIPNVITSVELERMMDPTGPTGGKILRPSDGKEAKDIAFIQCAGSRDRNYLKHCSRICCTATLKHTTYVREQYGDEGKSTIYYIDIRAIDRFEDLYHKTKADKTVSFLKSKVANITQDKTTANPILHGVNTEGYQRYTNAHELVVLAIGMEPSVDFKQLGVNLSINEHGFIENDPSNGGMFGAGVATDALDVNRAVQSATASALRAIQVVNQVATAEG
ncbi:MAG: CoB--CoM heterodisulfide reductase iron-sulfur subunit A family protein [Thiomargarita sp.]|nr:CoB--CoM heterodisulfide reductase iron-sulfur subunit A family protein [Thiomargarita sp.]